MKVIREAIYKSIRNDANYSAEEMKKDVVKQFQDQYLLKVMVINIIALAWCACLKAEYPFIAQTPKRS